MYALLFIDLKVYINLIIQIVKCYNWRVVHGVVCIDL